MRANEFDPTDPATWPTDKTDTIPSWSLGPDYEQQVERASTPDPDSPPCTECGGGLEHFPECWVVTGRAPCGHRFDCGCGAPLDPPQDE